jgi:hypothetical protein
MLISKETDEEKKSNKIIRASSISLHLLSFPVCLRIAELFATAFGVTSWAN